MAQKPNLTRRWSRLQSGWYTVRLCSVLLGEMMIQQIKNWFYETFGQRTIERTYIGHGDFLEVCGWDFRGEFVPRDPVEYKEYLEKCKEPRG